MSVHPSVNHPEVYTAERAFAQALTLITRSGVVPLIEEWRVQQVAAPRGAFKGALPYTLPGALVALACVLLRRAEPTIRTVYRTLLDFSTEQLACVGIDDAELMPIRANADRGLISFRGWLERSLSCLDSAPDQPARRTLHAEHKAIVASRSAEQESAYAIAAERLSIVVNLIVSASIDEKYRHSGRGDLIVDETIIDISAASYGLGVRDDRYRPAVYFAGYYQRDSRNQVDSTGAPIAKKRAWGVGITAVSSVGPPEALHSRPVLFTGLSIHPPTSGSLQGLDEAVRHHKANGFDNRPQARNARWPLLTCDMGYLKDGFDRWQLTNRYAAVFRYPQHWSTDYASVPTNPAAEVAPGPVQLSGAWYCPTAAEISMGRDYVTPLREVLTADDWEARERRLRQLLPRLMGVDRRAFEANTVPGRPVAGEEPDRSLKLVLTCPASLGNVRCTRWNNPDTADSLELPLIEPPDTMPYYTCCTQPTVTVTLTEQQRKRQQWSQFAPGSHDHAIYYEAARSLTEQRFSLIKSRTAVGLVHLKYGARREPFMKLVIAIAFAVVNLRTIELAESPRPKRPESVRAKWRRLERDLGKPPIRMPPRS
ncbi:hypothetical protein [Gordonia sp. NPDC003376]